MCAYWHGLAKLRMHTDITLTVMDNVTTTLGAKFRNFQMNICSTYRTKELKREEDACKRRQAKSSTTHEVKSQCADNNGRKKKTLNLQTYKFHALGDYVETIRRYGTTDSYSTALVSLTLL
jgi:hypothetical protein